MITSHLKTKVDPVSKRHAYEIHLRQWAISNICNTGIVNQKVKENQVGLELNGAHQLLVYGDDINLLGDSINAIKKNTNNLRGQ
jgi:hypothetical protein